MALKESKHIICKMAMTSFEKLKRTERNFQVSASAKLD